MYSNKRKISSNYKFTAADAISGLSERSAEILVQLIVATSATMHDSESTCIDSHVCYVCI